MASINQHVSAVRQILKQYQKDSLYTNELIYHHLMNAVAIVNKRKAEAYAKMNDWNVPAYCIGTEVTKEHPCECVEAGCDLVRTRHAIPRPLTSKHRTLMNVMTLNNKVIPEIEPEVASAYMLDEIRRNSMFYFVLNQHIYIVNSNVKAGQPKALVIKGFWEDISDWESIKLCNEEGKDLDKYCFDMDAHDLPVDRDYVQMAYQLLFEALGLSFQFKSDKTNNLNPEI